ncbi:MAG TPA: type II toxin-antitoxin system prevent-host-death family antitoxin [bacterium]|jgi:prevent-host-death family protein
MKELSIREAREQLARIEELLAREQEVTITRRGKPIARLLPVHHHRAVPSHQTLRKAGPRLTVASETLIREDRDER